MQFIIEQIAIAPTNPHRAKQLLRDMGAASWVEDHVVAQGTVFDKAAENEANLSFNYNMMRATEESSQTNELLEFEVLHYTAGDNWIEYDTPLVSHLGMHCSAEDLARWKVFFSDRGFSIAQEVFTTSHSNPAIAGQRWYQYCIFNTRYVLGVDLKFIVRRNAPPTQGEV